MTQQLFAGLAQRVGWTAFTGLLGRWIGPQVANYVAATVTRPLVLPLAAVGLGALVTNAVQHRLLANYPNVRQSLASLLNGVAFFTGGLAVATAVIYLVTWNNRGPLNRMIEGVVDVATRPVVLTDSEIVALLSA